MKAGKIVSVQPEKGAGFYYQYNPLQSKPVGVYLKYRQADKRQSILLFCIIVSITSQFSAVLSFFT
jgi:hypothetical protein